MYPSSISPRPPPQDEFAMPSKSSMDSLSPSVKNALVKVFPDLKSTIDQLGTNEPNVIIPLSVAKRYAVSKTYNFILENNCIN